MSRCAIPDTLDRQTALLKLAPPLWQGAVVCPDHVPEASRRAYQRQWGDWLRANPDRACWPLWAADYVTARKYEAAKKAKAATPTPQQVAA